jgi:hypothetical protein
MSGGMPGVSGEIFSFLFFLLSVLFCSSSAPIRSK